MMRGRRTSMLDTLPAAHRRYLEDGVYETLGTWSLYEFCYQGGAAAAWARVRDAIVMAWVETRPGTRPFFWWHAEAPTTPVHAPGRPAHGDLVAQRLRISGTGTPAHEVLNVAPSFQFGLPEAWVSVFDEAFYNGKAADIFGQRIGLDYREGDFRGVAPRGDDPPTFESQATFLDRHSLFLAGERDRLPAEAFAPEAIVIPADAVDVRAQFPDVFATKIFDETIQ